MLTVLVITNMIYIYIINDAMLTVFVRNFEKIDRKSD
jgi:hypothetical protein